MPATNDPDGTQSFHKWSVFEATTVDRLPPGEYHTMPCDLEGEPQPGHTYDGRCACGDEILVAEDRFIVTHNFFVDTPADMA